MIILRLILSMIPKVILKMITDCSRRGNPRDYGNLVVSGRVLIRGPCSRPDQTRLDQSDPDQCAWSNLSRALCDSLFDLLVTSRI